MNTRDDLAPLNLSIDIRGSSQPFPSPGSAFIPPPVPGPHEFAIRPSSAHRKMSKKDGADDPRSQLSSTNGYTLTPSSPNPTPESDLATINSTSPNGVVSPTRAATAPPDSSAPPMPDNSHRCSTSLSPTSQTPPDPSHDPSTSADSPISLKQPNSNPNYRLSTNSATSLTSSRPAPPSPAVSRRASGISRAARSRPVSGMSTTSSKSIPRSRPVSGSVQLTISGTSGGTDTLSRTPSGRRPKDILSMSAVTALQHEPSDIDTPTLEDSLVTPIATIAATVVPGVTSSTLSTTTTPEPLDVSMFIKIRDYGFTSSDPRFSGHGANVPRPNRPSYLAKRLRHRSSSDSSSSSSSSEEDGEGEKQWDESGTNGWGGFRWGIGRAWGFGRGVGVGGSAGFGGETGAGFPSRGDLDRNFGAQVVLDGDDNDDDDLEDDMDMDIDEEEVDEPYEEGGESELLLPGLYRALYAFEPEGTAEMKLEEDQVVRVVGRGGGVGWAVVVKDGLKDTGVHALVPESYLEPVRLDGDAEEDT